MYRLKIFQVGDEVGITLPEAILQKLKVREGDSIVAKETADGFEIMTDNTEFEKAMKIYQKGSQQYQNALRELAQ